jgi:hypothetical protein
MTDAELVAAERRLLRLVMKGPQPIPRRIGGFIAFGDAADARGEAAWIAQLKAQREAVLVARKALAAARRRARRAS